MPNWSDGLLGGADRAVNWADEALLGSTTQVPAGANYRPEDQRMARMAMLGSAGASLLAAAQNGPVGSRARHFEQLGQAPVAYAGMMQQAEQAGMQRQLQTAQVGALNAKARGATSLAAALRGGPPVPGGGGPMPGGVTQASYAPINGAGGGAPPAGGGYYTTLVGVENATGNPAAKNPLSTATGNGQFIEGTWNRFAAANPQHFQNMTPQQILAKRADPNLSMEATHWLAKENAAALSAAGLPVNDGTVALGHRFGAVDAVRLLQAQPGMPASAVLSEDILKANPTLASATVGGVVRGIGAKFGSGNTWERGPGGGGLPPVAGGAAPPGGGLNPNQAALARPGPGYNGNTLANMPPELRAMAVAKADAGDTDGAADIVTKWVTAPPRTTQTVTVNGEVRELDQNGGLGRSYGRAGAADGTPMSPADVARFPNLDPRKPYYMKDGVPHEIGSASTNVTIQNDNAGREIGIKRIEQARTLSDPVMSGAVPQALVMREQLQAGLATGQIDDATLTARTVLQSMGLLTPEQAQKADSQTLFRSMSSSMIPRMRAAGSGSSSDLDVTMFARAAPTLSTSPMGNLTIASTFIQVAEHEQKRISAMEEYLGEKGNLIGFDKHWKTNGPPLFPRVTTREEALTAYPPGTVIMLPPEAKSEPTYPFYVVPGLGAPPAAGGPPQAAPPPAPPPVAAPPPPQQMAAPRQFPTR